MCQHWYEAAACCVSGDSGDLHLVTSVAPTNLEYYSDRHVSCNVSTWLKVSLFTPKGAWIVFKADNVFKCKKRSYKLRGHNCCVGVGTHPGTPGRYAAGLSTSQTEPWRETQRGWTERRKCVEIAAVQSKNHGNIDCERETTHRWGQKLSTGVILTLVSALTTLSLDK